MEIEPRKIANTHAESILHIIDITGQLISKIAVKSNLAATDPKASFAIKSKILPPDLVQLAIHPSVRPAQ